MAIEIVDHDIEHSQTLFFDTYMCTYVCGPQINQSCLLLKRWCHYIEYGRREYPTTYTELSVTIIDDLNTRLDSGIVIGVVDDQSKKFYMVICSNMGDLF